MYPHIHLNIRSLSDDCLKDLQLQFNIDPLLLRLIVQKTSVNNLLSLVRYVPLSVLLMRLTQECYHQIKVVPCMAHVSMQF